MSKNVTSVGGKFLTAPLRFHDKLQNLLLHLVPSEFELSKRKEGHMTQRRNLTVIIIALVATVSGGCSISGFTAQSIVGSSKPTSEIISCSNIKSVKPGTSLDVVMKDGSSANGSFLGTEKTSQTESSIILKTENENIHVDINKVRTIQSEYRGNPKLTGLLIGAAAEAIGVFLIAKTIK